MPERYILLLGSNLGVRTENLSHASERISRQVGAVDSKSAIYETAAWGNTDQDPFLNQVVSGMTVLEPLALLESVLSIEKSLGRVRGSKWEPRIIDIDILFLGEQRIAVQGLEIPHPLLHLRRFTLAPLCDIFPEFRHPILGKSLVQLLDELDDPLQVNRYMSSK